MDQLSRREKLRRLVTQEYAPMALLLLFWFMLGLAVGPLDAARLLAAMTLVRATLFLTRLPTTASLKRRYAEGGGLYRQALGRAALIQLGTLMAQALVLAVLILALRQVGEAKIAALLPYVALWLPARALRYLTPWLAGPGFRPILSGSGVLLAGAGLICGWDLPTIGLVFGLREWLAYLIAILLYPRKVDTLQSMSEPLRWREVAGHAFLTARRVLTYRFAKTVLGVLGPVGTATARTGRSLQWDRRIEPYIPQRLGGFLIAGVLAAAIAATLAIYPGGPIAMVIAAGALQLAGITFNLSLLWPYRLPEGQGAFEDDGEDD